MRNLVFLAIVLALAGCQTAGSFDPVKTQVAAHNNHAAAALASQVAAESGVVHGANAATAIQALDKSEDAILVTDALLQVVANPDVQAAAKADADATAKAEAALATAATH